MKMTKQIEYQLLITVPAEWIGLEGIAQRIHAGIKEYLPESSLELYLINEGKPQEVV